MDYNYLVGNYVASYANYQFKQARLRDKIDLRQQQIDRLEAKLKRLIYPHWIDTLIKPLANELIKFYPDRTFEILGPFGLCNETAIHFYKKDAPTDKQFERDNCLSMTFIHGDLTKGEFMIRDYSIDTNQFSKSTIGELNGMNHPSIKIPLDATLEWFKQYIR